MGLTWTLIIGAGLFALGVGYGSKHPQQPWTDLKQKVKDMCDDPNGGPSPEPVPPPENSGQA